MEEYITKNFLPILCSILMSLILYIFGLQSKQLTEIKRKQDNCPISNLPATIAEIRTDIKWIKGKLFNE